MTSAITLRQWRREALILKKGLIGFDSNNEFTRVRREYAERVIILTQELMDLELIKKG
jgi:hypothetical protein